MTLGKNRLRLRPPLPQRTPHAVGSAARPDRAWLDKGTRHRYPCLVAGLVAQWPYGVDVAQDAWGQSPWLTCPCGLQTARP